jgi:C-terminal processing protease CtpA/Prc
MGIGLFRINKGSDGKFYFNSFQSKLKKPNPNRYKGKVYVLINGGSFSASSLLSSNLKGSGRAVFVGEETGGAYNGCVAGFMPVHKLPHSKLNLKFGIAQIQPFFKTEIIGRGIFPDIEVLPTIEDRLKGIDPEITRVLEDFKKSNE